MAVAGSVQVVVEQPADCRIGFSGVIGGGEGAGVFAEQVVQTVAGRRLGEQMLVIELIEAAANIV